MTCRIIEGRQLSLTRRNLWLTTMPQVYQCLRSQQLLKVLTSIASRSHTVTDPQPNEINIDKPSQLYPHHPTVLPSQLHRTSQRFAIAASPHSWLICQDQTLPHTMPGHTHIGSWLYCSHGWLLHEPILRFGYDNKPEATGNNQTQPQIVGYNQTQFPFLSPQILISRILSTLMNKPTG